MDAGPLVEVTRGLGPGFFNLENLLMPQNIALIVVSWALTELIARSSRGFSFVQERLLPVLPVAFCVAFVFATTSWQPTATYGERVLLGTLLGTVTVWGHMAAQSSGLHALLPFMKRPREAAEAGSAKNAPDPKKSVDGPGQP